ncbi:MAG: type II toxin-antitoxin system PemK/MazF family toxin [Phototrophicales bacterium]|nr:type II toxin-antitoxin system PemK/MazF family toxin [Phototrophicales bacterium]
MVINIGDIYWLHTESEDEIPHPHVIIFTDDQHTLFAMYALTTNMKKISIPGNILLDVDEGNLPKQSIVEVGKVSTADKSQLGEYIGSLSEKRVKQIVSGIIQQIVYFTPYPNTI